MPTSLRQVQEETEAFFRQVLAPRDGGMKALRERETEAFFDQVGALKISNESSDDEPPFDVDTCCVCGGATDGSRWCDVGCYRAWVGGVDDDRDQDLFGW